MIELKNNFKDFISMVRNENDAYSQFLNIISLEENINK